MNWLDGFTVLLTVGGVFIGFLQWRAQVRGIPHSLVQFETTADGKGVNPTVVKISIKAVATPELVSQGLVMRSAWYQVAHEIDRQTALPRFQGEWKPAGQSFQARVGDILWIRVAMVNISPGVLHGLHLGAPDLPWLHRLPGLFSLYRGEPTRTIQSRDPQNGSSQVRLQWENQTANLRRVGNVVKGSPIANMNRFEQAVLDVWVEVTTDRQRRPRFLAIRRGWRQQLAEKKRWLGPPFVLQGQEEWVDGEWCESWKDFAPAGALERRPPRRRQAAARTDV